MPHRQIAEEMLLGALPPHVRRFVDLGTGDGRLMALVRSRHSDAVGIGLDFSAPMLDRARERFIGDPHIDLRVHDLDDPLPELNACDAFVSGLALHHLEDERKQELFGEVHSRLMPGGVFANLDLVSSASPRLHERFRREIGRVEDDPTDRLAELAQQMAWLDELGFSEVDCHFKWLELSLIVAVK